MYSFGLKIYRKRWTVLAVWVVLLLIALPFAPRATDTLKPGGFSNDNLPSAQARAVFRDRLDLTPISYELIFRSDTHGAYEDEFTSDLQNALTRIGARPEVARVVTHLDDPARVSPDGRSVHVTIGLSLDLEDARDFLDTARPLIEPGRLGLIFTGGPPLYADISLSSERDVRRAEILAFPLSTVALLLVFGTIVAAFLPATVGGVGVVLALAAVALISRGVDMSVFVLNIVTLLGIGLGIDYSLFFTSRFREQIAAGDTVEEAVGRAQATAGAAILFSGVTSLIGLASLVAFEFMMLRSVGIGAVIVITAAILAALTLMPAVLGILGPRINAFRVMPSFLGGNDRDIWGRLSHWVMARPLTVAVPTILFLLLLAAPVRDIRLGTVDATILPTELESRRGFDILRDEFGLLNRTQIPVAYVFSEAEDTDPLSPGNLERLYAFGRALEGLNDVTRVRSIVNVAPDLDAGMYATLYKVPEAVTDVAVQTLLRDSIREGAVLFLVESDVEPFGPEASGLVSDIRAFDPGLDAALFVDGGSAEIKDVVDSLYGRFPIVAGIVIIATYVSLLVLFRSVVLPIKAILLNVMSILASYGALVFVFQQGHFSGLLGFEPMGVIEATTPILLFSIIFGLSMDYEIFLLARVSESYKRSRDNTAAVAEGLKRSGRIITGAASILIVVALSFMVADVVLVKAIGLGLAIAIFVDVTIVRSLLAPSIMRLLGPLNWWIPRWLDRILPRIDIAP
ncbi:MAG: MMPL family transporter [Dehalococcoidia bacterium]|nr:MMPL family transporter [Dehalococcoidia bacterium]